MWEGVETGCQSRWSRIGRIDAGMFVKMLDMEIKGSGLALGMDEQIAEMPAM